MGRGRREKETGPGVQSSVRTWALQLGSNLSSAKVPAALCLSVLVCPVRIITVPTLVGVRVDLHSVWGAQSLVRARAAVSAVICRGPRVEAQR